MTTAPCFDRRTAMLEAIAQGDGIGLFRSTGGRMTEFEEPGGHLVSFRVCLRCHAAPSGHDHYCLECVDLAAWEREVPAKFQHARLDAVEAIHPAEVTRALRSWLEAPGSTNLIQHGPPGNGKTFNAVALAWEVHSGDPVVFTTASGLVRDLRQHQLDDNDHFDRYARARLLLLDDLGAETLTEWAAERLLMVVDARYTTGRPILVTSNWSPDQLLPRVGERIWDRLREGALIVPVIGESLRREMAS